MTTTGQSSDLLPNTEMIADMLANDFSLCGNFSMQGGFRVFEFAHEPFDKFASVLVLRDGKDRLRINFAYGKDDSKDKKKDTIYRIISNLIMLSY
jgi:hypothetical protein